MPGHRQPSRHAHEHPLFHDGCKVPPAGLESVAGRNHALQAPDGGSEAIIDKPVVGARPDQAPNRPIFDAIYNLRFTLQAKVCRMTLPVLP